MMSHKIPMRVKGCVALTLSHEDLLLMVLPAETGGTYEAYVHQKLRGHTYSNVHIKCIAAHGGFTNEVDAWNWLDVETKGKSGRDYVKLKVV